MTTYATVDDVAVNIGRPISDAIEVTQVAAWLARVEARIRLRIPALDTLALDVGYLAILVGIEVDVVTRRVLNPESRANERIDDYSYGLNENAKSNDLWLLESEWNELMPARPRCAFSVRPRFGS